MFLFLPIGYGE